MINNFWSFDCIKRFREKADGYGIETVEVSEYNTSTICPKCRSDHTYKHKRLFKCLKCGFEAHRDAVGVINMGTLCRGHLGGGTHNLRWNDARWEGKSPTSHRPMITI